MGQKELKPATLEEQMEETKERVEGLLRLCIPPKEVIDEIKRDFLTAQVSILKIFKTLLDYQIQTLERLAEGEGSTQKGKKSKVQKIKVE